MRYTTKRGPQQQQFHEIDMDTLFVYKQILTEKFAILDITDATTTIAIDLGAMRAETIHESQPCLITDNSK